MRRGVNKVILVGSLGGDPELRWTNNNEAVANFSVATGTVWKDRQTGQEQEHTEWHRVSAFRRTAEICGEYLAKGAKVYIEGHLKTRKWQDQSGTDHYSTGVVVDELRILDGGKDGQSQPQYRQEGPPNTPPPQEYQPKSQRQSSQTNHYQRANRAGPPPDARYNPNGSQVSPYANNAPSVDYSEFDDDIPF